MSKQRAPSANEIAEYLVDDWLTRERVALSGTYGEVKAAMVVQWKRTLRDRITTALTAAEQRGAERLAEIDKFRLSGRNVTFWCTPRAVVTQITFHDDDAGPDIDKSFGSFGEAINFALERTTENRKGE